MNPEWFANRLRELREAKGWTQQQLADAAGIKLGGVRNLEQGRRSPVWETVIALCQALGVNCDQFMVEPTDRPPAGPGRPRKTQAEETGVKATGKAKGKRSGKGKAEGEKRTRGKRKE